MNTNNDLTILLTLKDRAAYTKRWLAYAVERRCPFLILIADGSDTNENADMVQSYLSELNIQYCRYPLDKNYFAYYQKVADAVAKINTPFVVKANNDDFYDFAVLSQGVDLLLKNNAYHSCYIKPMSFSVTKPFFIDSWTSDSIIATSDRASARLNLYFSGTPGAYDNIHRTAFYLQFWQAVVAFQFRDIRSHEYLLNTLSYVSGNIAMTSSYGYFREESGQGNTCQVETNTLKEMMQPHWMLEQQQVAEYVAEHLIKQETMDKETAIKFYFDGLRNFLSGLVVRDLLADPVLSNENRKHIYSLAIKDIVSHSRFNQIARTLKKTKNRVKKTEKAFLPTQQFLETWYSTQCDKK